MFTATVRDLTFQGLGVIDSPEGVVCFVKGAWLGDVAEFEIIKLEKRYGTAKLVKLLVPSTERVSALCSYQSLCGGCPWMFVDYSAQLREKQKIIEKALTRLDLGQQMDRIRPILPSLNVLGYRNRAQFKTDGKVLGFFEPDSHQIVDLETCVVLNPLMNQNLKYLRARLPNEFWEPTHPKKPWMFLDIDDRQNLESGDDFEVNRSRPFRQGNTEQNRRMKAWLSEQLKETLPTGLVELFSGQGNFTQVVSDAGVKRIVAFEGSKEATQSLANRNLKNVTAYPLNLTLARNLDRIKNLTQDLDQKIEAILLDPPREGFELIGELASSLTTVQTIYYISCDAQSYARDVKNLIKVGFELHVLQPIDCCPHTPHVEIMSVLRKSR